MVDNFNQTVFVERIRQSDFECDDEIDSESPKTRQDRKSLIQEHLTCEANKNILRKKSVQMSQKLLTKKQHSHTNKQTDERT